jgi:hypothetical protein
MNLGDGMGGRNDGRREAVLMGIRLPYVVLRRSMQMRTVSESSSGRPRLLRFLAGADEGYVLQFWA